MAQVVVSVSVRHEAMGSNPDRSVTFLAENIPVLNGLLVYIFFVKIPLSLQLWKNFYRLTAIVAGMSSLLVIFVTGIVANMVFPTFVADHGCVSSPPNVMIHMALDWWRRSMISERGNKILFIRRWYSNSWFLVGAFRRKTQTIVVTSFF